MRDNDIHEYVAKIKSKRARRQNYLNHVKDPKIRRLAYARSSRAARKIKQKMEVFASEKLKEINASLKEQAGLLQEIVNLCKIASIMKDREVVELFIDRHMVMINELEKKIEIARRKYHDVLSGDVSFIAEAQNKPVQSQTVASQQFRSTVEGVNESGYSSDNVGGICGGMAVLGYSQQLPMLPQLYVADRTLPVSKDVFSVAALVGDQQLESHELPFSRNVFSVAALVGDQQLESHELPFGKDVFSVAALVGDQQPEPHELPLSAVSNIGFFASPQQGEISEPLKGFAHQTHQ